MQSPPRFESGLTIDPDAVDPEFRRLVAAEVEEATRRALSALYFAELLAEFFSEPNGA